MTKHHAYFNPYFASDEFQESSERKIEKSIEDKCKSIICLITKIWKHSPKKITIEEFAKKIATEDKELLDRLKD